ncbi:MAG: lytic transglycosylase domain-containing protein [Proteobacteria bacterium]|nr:lytic transglycosylase domain-containing protein [Pseudomonadota bacterium]
MEKASGFLAIAVFSAMAWYSMNTLMWAVPARTLFDKCIAPISNIFSGVVSTNNNAVSTQQQSSNAVIPLDVSKTSNGSPSAPKIPAKYNELITDAASRSGINRALIVAVMAVESNFNPRATSSSGAHGLMQLMPETARFYGVKDTFDPSQSISAGSRYLSYLINRFNGNLKLALAAYNAGPTLVIKSGYKVPAITQTQDYVKKVLAYYTFYQNT